MIRVEGYSEADWDKLNRNERYRVIYNALVLHAIRYPEVIHVLRAADPLKTERILYLPYAGNMQAANEIYDFGYDFPATHYELRREASHYAKLPFDVLIRTEDESRT